MREAKICVFDASLERKMIRKVGRLCLAWCQYLTKGYQYAQAFLSGCIVAADLPTEHEEALREFIIPLKRTWDIDRIHAEIQSYLARPDRLHQMAMDAFVYARQHLTTTCVLVQDNADEGNRNKVSHVLRMADDYRRGVRGYECECSQRPQVGAERSSSSA